MKLKWTRKTIVAIALIVVGLPTFILARGAASEARLYALSGGPPMQIICDPAINWELERAVRRDRPRLNLLGSRTAGSEIEAELRGFLDHPSYDFRYRAMRLLARLENPENEAVLQAIADRDNSNMAKVAAARIRYRNLHGRAKLNAICYSVGVTWNDMVWLSRRPDFASGEIQHDWGARLVLRELIDVIASMANKGEDVSGLYSSYSWSRYPGSWYVTRAFPGSQLNLGGTGKIPIEAAKLPPDDEIRALIHYISALPGIRTDESDLESYIIGFGPKVPDLLIEHLDVIAKDPKPYTGLRRSPDDPRYFRQNYGLKITINLCQLSRDPRIRAKMWNLVHGPPVPGADPTGVMREQAVTYLQYAY